MTMKRTLTIAALIVLFSAGSVFAEKVLNNNVAVRKNAGAFYPVMTIINAGEQVKVLETKGTWKKVKTSKGDTGWISANAFNSVSSSVDYGLMAKAGTQKNMSKIMVTAAVKGFYENEMDNSSLNKALFENPFVSYVTPEEYETFVKETYRNRWDQSKFQKKTSIKMKGAFKIDEDLVALSSYICARLGAPGLSEDRELTTYVNEVAQLVMESTEFYDLPICVHVVKTDQIFANATPIGVIMISEGMLKTVKSENELASLLGHEIAHVTLHHGAKEMVIRQPKINADEAFDEMGEELGVDEDEKEMDALCNELYEKAIKGRKAEYEYEADQRGMLYAQRAGYDPQGMISLLMRLKTRIPASRNVEDASHWLPNAIDKRISKLAFYYEGSFKPNSSYVDLKVRYRIYIK
jgi:uncharacterized protein YraI